jgi:transcriptional regulator with XRE-family HTH domain
MAGAAGAAIREDRQRRRWSLRRLAGEAGISPARLAEIEAGEVSSLEAYARVFTALDREPELQAVDRWRRTSSRDGEDFVHAAMGEMEARRLHGYGFEVRIDEPYQHYQFAGRADVVAWDRERRALLHLENRTRFPNVQESLGAFGAKRAYLGAVLAERYGIRGGWSSETHVIVGLWSSEVLHVIRLRDATFRAACPSDDAAFRAWWSGHVPELAGVASTLVLLDPAPAVRDGFRISVPTAATRPRHRGYPDAAEVLRRGKRNARENPDH